MNTIITIAGLLLFPALIIFIRRKEIYNLYVKLYNWWHEHKPGF